MMSEIFKQILENAIRDEAYFHEFYKRLALFAKDKKVSQELLKLSEQEKLHKEKLESLSFEKIGENIIPEKVDELAIEEASLAPIEDFKSVNDMLVFAIKQEILARTAYMQLAKATTDAKVGLLFTKLANEEKTHELILTGKLASAAWGEVSW